MKHTFALSTVALVLAGLGVTLRAQNQPPSVPPESRLRILLTNDDGFESRNLQALYTTLKAAGHDVILSAPYRNQSGMSARYGFYTDLSPTDSASPEGVIAAGAPGVGPTTIDVDQYYVDSTPVGAVLYGLEVMAPKKWGVAPDLVISGPNNGNNLGLGTPHSGTVGAAITALNSGIPALAVSGDSANAATAPLLAAITRRVMAAAMVNGRIGLPAGIGLNVNVPELNHLRTAESYPVAFTQVVSDPGNEIDVFLRGGTVTISPIQGTFQAAPNPTAMVLRQMRALFSSAASIRNPQMINLAVRGYVGVGAAVQIAGFTVAGTETVLIRASGPALVPLGVPGTLADPYVELFDAQGQSLGRNDNWSDDAATEAEIARAANRVGAFAWKTGSRDAALLVTLPAGGYTVVVSGVGDTTGVALIEAYDAN